MGSMIVRGGGGYNQRQKNDAAESQEKFLSRVLDAFAQDVHKEREATFTSDEE